MDKVQWHLQGCLPAKNRLAKPEPPVARCLPAHAELAGTRGKGLQKCCRTAAWLLHGCCMAASPWQAFEKETQGAACLARP